MGVEKRKYMKKKREKTLAEKVEKTHLFPVFLYADRADDNQVVARYMFPVSGMVEAGYVVVDDFSGADSVPMVVKCGGISVEFYGYKKAAKYEVGLPIGAGEKIEFYTKNPNAFGYWIAFGWRPQG